MRMPRPRLPLRGKKPSSGEKGKYLKPVLGGFAVFLLFFILGFYLLFPADALRERIESEVALRSDLDLQIARMELNFPPALSASEVSASLEELPLPPLQIDSLRLNPRWLSLAGGNQGVDFRAELYRGWMEGSLRRSGALEAEFASIGFSLPLMEGYPLRAEGMVDRGAVALVLPPREKDASRLDVSLDQVKVSGLEAFGISGEALSLGRVSLTGKGIGRSFDVEQLSATGGDLEVTGDGSIYLAVPMERSRINLIAVVRPSPGLDRAVADLLPLVGTAGGDGSRRIRLTGTLARPVVR